MFGLAAAPPPEPSLWLEHGQRLELGGLTLEVRHTPGHSPGGVSFLLDDGQERVVVVVTCCSPVPSAAPTCGAAPSRCSSVDPRAALLAADDTRVVCGHGPDTTVGEERRTNPFVQG